MAWAIVYHQGVKNDLRELGEARAQKVLRVIEDRIINGEPNKSGKALSGSLAGYRRIRTGNTRIIYRVIEDKIEIFISTVGNRRDDEVYDLALTRLQ